ncbi:MAG: hypothetical protein J6386_12800 [Candidatus Synoicihabitans palmerolidicus]|nr:hypothetical protein [Candidatus Synoicihabitans palmerolidicus]
MSDETEAYRTRFEVTVDVAASGQIWLTYDGLDTLAKVTLNGTVWGKTQNMFHAVNYDVKAAPIVEGSFRELTDGEAAPLLSLLGKLKGGTD